MRSVMLPMEDRDTILAVAQRYGVDYLMMPPDRPAGPDLHGSETGPVVLSMWPMSPAPMCNSMASITMRAKTAIWLILALALILRLGYGLVQDL